MSRRKTHEKESVMTTGKGTFIETIRSAHEDDAVLQAAIEIDDFGAIGRRLKAIESPLYGQWVTFFKELSESGMFNQA